MADSDDEGEGRKSRDKFKRERSDYGDRYRRDSQQREDGSRRRSRDHRSDSRSEFSPPFKRHRRESWEAFGDGPYQRGGGWHHPEPGPGGPPPAPTGFSIMSFKQFLAQQDDSISDQEAVQKYADYKLEVQKMRLQLFFDKHKSEEWFRVKYHPIVRAECLAQEIEDCKVRQKAFAKLIELDLVDKVPLCVSGTASITRLMDSAVIFMEGGTEYDLKVLDKQETSAAGENAGTAKVKNEEDSSLRKYDLGAKQDEADDDKESVKSEGSGSKSDDDESDKDKSDQTGDTTAEVDANGDKDDSERQVMDGNTAAPDEVGKPAEDDHEPASNGQEDRDSGVEEEKIDVDPKSEVTEGNEDEKTDEQSEGQPQEETSVDQQPDTTGGKDDSTEEIEDKKLEEEPPQENDCQEDKATTEATSITAPRPLHVTKSVYMRHIPPSISTADILEVCNSFSGYRRIAMDDPDVEKNYERRGWVTFGHDSNIREVTSELTSVKNCQLTCMANRELSRRVKPFNSFVYSKELVKEDIKLACELISYLDKKQKLIDDSQTNTLVKEAMASVAELTASSGTESKKLAVPTTPTDNDGLEEGEQELDEEGALDDPSDQLSGEEGDQWLQVVDRLIWYLRIVHSVDYYSGVIIAQEHHMPHQCGIVTTRPQHVDGAPVAEDAVSKYLDTIKSKIGSLLVAKERLSDEEAATLGKKDVDTEVEKFIKDNTKEISKEKYLCPLSGKKFRGPEFVRKHIFNKHSAKLDALKQDVEFFNEYLHDSDRPMPLESELKADEGSSDAFSPGAGGADFVPWSAPPPPHMMMFRRGMFPPAGFPPDPFAFRGRMRRGRGRGRRIVEYHDFDAPADMEF